MRNLTKIAIFTLALGQIVWAQDPDQPRGAGAKVDQNDDKTRKALRIPRNSLGGEETLKTLVNQSLGSRRGRPEAGRPGFGARYTSSTGVIYYGIQTPRGPSTPPWSNAIFPPLPPGAKKIAFVLDRSGSMNWGIETGSIPAPGSNEKTRYDILCKELGKFLDDIGPSKSFVIYMFSTDSVVMPLSAGPPHTMVPTTTPNKSSSMNWVTTTMAPNNGGTKPLDAIKDALNHEPDVIYFLTDGTFSPDPTTEAAEAAVISYIDTNKGNTIINTIGLSSAANMVPLETIANLTGGKAYPVEFP